MSVSAERSAPEANWGEGSRKALLISAGQYSEPRLGLLDAPETDSRELAEVLGNQAIGGFNVTRLHDPTSQQVREEIEALLLSAGRRDLVLIYFSCHGITSPLPHRRLFFAMPDTKLDSLRSTSIPASFLYEIMRESRAARQILILDCCHSGAFKRELIKSTTEAPVIDSFRELGKHSSGIAVITASQSLQYALQDEPAEGARRSVFTKEIIHGLTTGDADLDADGLISTEDLFDYARGRMIGHYQEPEMSLLGARGKIYLARARWPADKFIPISSVDALRDDDPLWRVTAIAGLRFSMAGPDQRVAAAARRRLEDLANDIDDRVARAANSAIRDDLEIDLSGFSHDQIASIGTRAIEESASFGENTPMKEVDSSGSIKSGEQTRLARAFLEGVLVRSHLSAAAMAAVNLTLYTLVDRDMEASKRAARFAIDSQLAGFGAVAASNVANFMVHRGDKQGALRYYRCSLRSELTACTASYQMARILLKDDDSLGAASAFEFCIETCTKEDEEHRQHRANSRFNLATILFLYGGDDRRIQSLLRQAVAEGDMETAGRAASRLKELFPENGVELDSERNNDA
ncbi:caspase family protein [Frankia sp. AgB1.9]|uniref:caspase family protein n=1 Tax=unclassified Frankia TaxID=2632575 RepID=UPI001932C131|nr:MULTISPECIES: caspase family protein [unclassified Frankia]MBL7487896.1 caspase family protein [Frankia sp. AgW1.1]MBL7549961.1 caspase family protein [Frankia sp. AgB1.9]MBL7621460.1 caspase family protein [Frankia sp. AgB1.8]